MKRILMVLAGVFLAVPALAAPVAREGALAAALGKLGLPLSAFAEHVTMPPDRPRAPWKFTFYQAPQAVAPGLCSARVARASVYADAAKPAASWLKTHFWVEAFRIVGPLDGPLAATRCVQPGTIASRFDTMPANVPNGAFLAPSVGRAWEAASLMRDVIGMARGEGAMPVTVVCDASGGDDCEAPQATLARFDLSAINQVRECDERSARCLVVNLHAGLGDISFWEVHIETTTNGLRGGRVTMILAVTPADPGPL